jgi:hypothetical protein
LIPDSRLSPQTPLRLVHENVTLERSEGYFGDRSQGSSAVMPCGVVTTPTVQPAPYRKRGFEKWRRELEMVPAFECSIQNHDQGAVEIVELRMSNKDRSWTHDRYLTGLLRSK